MNYKEELSDLEHEQWVHWTKYMMKSIHDEDKFIRWEKQIKIPYSELDDEDKEKDRKWADKVQAINSIRIFEYVNIKEPTSFDLFKLFADLTGFSIEDFNKRLKCRKEDKNEGVKKDGN